MNIICFVFELHHSSEASTAMIELCVKLVVSESAPQGLHFQI